MISISKFALQENEISVQSIVIKEFPKLCRRPQITELLTSKMPCTMLFIASSCGVGRLKTAKCLCNNKAELSTTLTCSY